MAVISTDELVSPGDIVVEDEAAPPPQSPSKTIDSATVLGVNEVEITEVVRNRIRREQRITWLAIAVVGGSALLSFLVIMRTELHQIGAVTRDHWAIEMLTLTLVSSLSFVMGVNSGSSTNN